MYRHDVGCGVKSRRAKNVFGFTCRIWFVPQKSCPVKFILFTHSKLLRNPEGTYNSRCEGNGDDSAISHTSKVNQYEFEHRFYLGRWWYSGLCSRIPTVSVPNIFSTTAGRNINISCDPVRTSTAVIKEQERSCAVANLKSLLMK